MESVDTELAALEPAQQAAIDALQQVARGLWPEALVEIYGSNYTRLALPMSDVYCVLVSRSCFAGDEPLTVLRKVSDAVHAKPWATRVALLASAKIPVLKLVYQDEHQPQDHDDDDEGAHPKPVMLDLTCGHSTGHSGLSARDLIYSFQAEMPALRPLVLVLKSHLSRFGMCGSMINLRDVWGVSHLFLFFVHTPRSQLLVYGWLVVVCAGADDYSLFASVWRRTLPHLRQ